MYFGYIVQCSTEGNCKESLTTPRALPLPGYNHSTPFPLENVIDESHLNANKDQESNVGREKTLYPAADKNQEGNEGGAEVLHTDAALTQKLPLGVTMDQKMPSVPNPDLEPDEHVCTYVLCPP